MGFRAGVLRGYYPRKKKPKKTKKKSDLTATERAKLKRLLRS